MVDGFGGAVTDPSGKGVEAPGVRVNGDGVPINKVEVGRAIKVGVAGARVAGDPHAVATVTNRIKLIRKTKSRLVFIVNSSFTACLTMIQTFACNSSFRCRYACSAGLRHSVSIISLTKIKTPG